jgi:hypothetical protein
VVLWAVNHGCSFARLTVVVPQSQFALVNVIMPLRKNLHWIKRKILDRASLSPDAEQRLLDEPESSMSAEEESKIELARLQRLIEDRKRLARDSDVCYHLWQLYKDCFQDPDAQLLHQTIQDGRWYDVKILQVCTRNGLNEFEFELNGGKYKFVDDEEKQGWRENLKYFSLFLYDDSNRCLIEIPMRMRVDSLGRDYAILMDGPRAFLPGRWINHFINVRLKHQSIHNQEIRSQKHQDRLREIEDLKTRYGIVD